MSLSIFVWIALQCHGSIASFFISRHGSIFGSINAGLNLYDRKLFALGFEKEVFRPLFRELGNVIINWREVYRPQRVTTPSSPSVLR